MLSPRSADPQQTHCGVITLVPATWQQRPGKGYAHNRAQLVLTWVWGIAILNHYAPPGSPEDTATNLLVAAAEHNLYNNQWISAGDANGVPVPHRSVIAAAIDSIGGAFHSDGQPTTNTGSKNIDWFASSPATLGSNPSRELVSLSDHFPIHLDIDRPNPGLGLAGAFAAATYLAQTATFGNRRVASPFGNYLVRPSSARFGTNFSAQFTGRTFRWQYSAGMEQVPSGDHSAISANSAAAFNTATRGHSTSAGLATAGQATPKPDVTPKGCPLLTSG